MLLQAARAARVSLAFCLAAAQTRPWAPWASGPRTLELGHPPLLEGQGNPVEVSLRLSDLGSLDEPNGKISVYGLFQLQWPDQRWYNASVKRVNDICSSLGGCSEEERAEAMTWSANQLDSLFGSSSDAFFKDVRQLGATLGFIHTEYVWTPIPPHLFLKTSSNPLGKTDFDPVISAVAIDEDFGFEALWIDRAKTYFDVTFSYEHFPFDQQSLELCLNFDFYTDPAGIEPRDNVGILRAAEKWNGPHTLSPFVSNKFVRSMQNQGFEVLGVELQERETSIGSALCLHLNLQRRFFILVLRFFWPLTALLFIPFAGFFIPIELVMPRVATGFISFLSLQVFRNQAYALIPKKSSSLLWMDVTMFSVTVIMFASVLENVLAQALRANVSGMCARYVDNLSRVTFPLIATLILLLVFILGGTNADTVLTLTLCMTLLGSWIVGFAITVILYVRRLPHTLIKTLVKQIVHTDFRYATVSALDKQELALVFRQLDANGSGNINAEEIRASFESHGLSFKRKEDELGFRAKLDHMFKMHGNGRSLDLKGFCHHFTELFHRDAAETQKEREQQAEEQAEHSKNDRMPVLPEVDDSGSEAQVFPQFSS